MPEPSGPKLAQIRIAGGIWEGSLVDAGADPVIEVVHSGQVVEGVQVEADAKRSGCYVVRVPIPAWALNEGVQTFLVRSGAATLAQFTLIAGVPLDEDIRAELSLLRAELDLLKRAFQRHVLEG